MAPVLAERQALEHVLRHHAGADGWITLSRREGDRFRQYHYRLEQLLEILPEWLGPDVYFSQNTFFKPARKIEHIRQLRSLYVDVDCYLLNFDPEWVIGSMEHILFREKIPDPNLIIYSGRGLVLVWLLDPVPPRALPLWQAVENYLVQQLKAYGGDAKASDAARVLRVAGTVNSKSNEAVFVQYRHDARYALRDIEREYLPELSPRRKVKPGQDPKMHRKLYRVYSLHYARLKDLVLLCEMRKWSVTGSREVVLFLYRYWSCCFLSEPREALENTLELNAQFTQPLPEKEVVRATRSAEKAWQARSNPEANEIARQRGYPGAGYNISNAKLIEWLDITEEEQRKLQTIVGRSVKYERNNLRRAGARRKAGKQTREEYIAQADERREKAKRMRTEGMSYRAIGIELGVSQTQARRLVVDSNI